MNKELIIEHYLSQLDRELQALPTGQRAEIITEIRSHILEALERDASKTVQSVLNDMGTPREVAARYLEQKGIKPWAPSPARNWLKWILIAFAGMTGLAVASVAALIWYFSPLIEVDELNGRVRMLGGWIDVNDAEGSFKVGTLKVDESGVKTSRASRVNDFTFRVGDEILSKAEGEEDLSARGVNVIRVPFNTAKIELDSQSGSIFKWECKNAGSAPPPVTVEAGVMTLDLNKVNIAKCELSIPENTKVEMKGVNGSLEVDEFKSDLDVSIVNGRVNIKPDDFKVYDFEVKVQNGRQDQFPRSQDKTALKVKVDVTNGAVRKE